MQSNYPDDIRCYDNDPRSPFFEPSKYKCDGCGLYFYDDELNPVGERWSHKWLCDDCLKTETVTS